MSFFMLQYWKGKVLYGIFEFTVRICLFGIEPNRVFFCRFHSKEKCGFAGILYDILLLGRTQVFGASSWNDGCKLVCS